jgi:hypothetical protein
MQLATMIPNRFIREDDFLYVAYVIDGVYRRPKSTNGIIIKPQFFVIDFKRTVCLEVIDYYIYQMLQKNDVFAPIATQLKLVPITHIVKDGDKVPKEIIKKALES